MIQLTGTVVQDFENLKLSEKFRGREVKYVDVLSAGLEAGVIQEAELDTVYNFKEYWNPKKNKFELVSGILRYATPFVPMSLGFALIAVEAIHDVKERKTGGIG